MSITDSLERKAHVVHYKTDDIPTKDEIEKILKIGYRLATSKQNAFPYKVWILGPNAERSEKLYQMTEQAKIDFDGGIDDKYQANPNLLHIKSAPWTLITAPRVAPPNPFAAVENARTGTSWEMGEESFIPRGRETWSIEVGMVAKTITGAVMDAGLDTSYCTCIKGQKSHYAERGFEFLQYYPYLIQTIGKADLYKWQNMKPESLAMDTRPHFFDVFEFVD